MDKVYLEVEGWSRSLHYHPRLRHDEKTAREMLAESFSASDLQAKEKYSYVTEIFFGIFNF